MKLTHTVILIVGLMLGGMVIASGAAYAECLVGDLNGDLKVNTKDYRMFRSDYGTTNPRSDFNGDGAVNLIDYSIFRSVFGTSITSINFDADGDGFIAKADLDYLKTLSVVAPGTSGDINCNGRIDEEEVDALENVLKALGLK